MSGIHPTTNSPSSLRSSRKTPCVEGCCGPIDSVISDSSGWSRTPVWFDKFSTAVAINKDLIVNCKLDNWQLAGNNSYQLTISQFTINNLIQAVRLVASQ